MLSSRFESSSDYHMKRLIVLYVLFILLAISPTLADSSMAPWAGVNESSFEDTLLNSPFLILGAIILVNIIALIYRKVRK